MYLLSHKYALLRGEREILSQHSFYTLKMYVLRTRKQRFNMYALGRETNNPPNTNLMILEQVLTQSQNR